MALQIQGLAVLSLLDLIRRYALETDVAPGTIDFYVYAVRALNRWAGRSLTTVDLTDDLLNRWIAARLEEGMRRATVRGQRGAILTLWRAAFDMGLTVDLPRRVRLVRVPATLPQAWDESQVAKLLAACETIRGRFRRYQIERRALLRACVLVDWYTGLRPGDLLRLRTTELIPSGGCFAVVQNKTAWPILCRLPDDAMAAVLATYPPDRDRVFPLDRRTLHWYFQRLTAHAGVPGSPKWLRRSGATACEAQQQGAAQAFLGHKTPGLAVKHYIDQRHLPERRPLPPAIG